jgi:DUF4097 and DUF4098 domain-containing protein YvlB
MNMKMFHKAIALAIVGFLAAGGIFAQEKAEVHKTFEGKRLIRIQTTSGDCAIIKGTSNKILVDLVYSVEPKEAFTPEINEAGDVLKLRERWHGSSSGEVSWTLTVPPKTEIEFSTASGELSIKEMNSSIEAETASGNITVENSDGNFEFSTASGDVILDNTKGEFEISTASGDIEANNIEGMIELDTASGDIDVKDSKGSFELSCASGDIDASNILIEGESSFSAASGNVNVSPAKSPEYDLELSAASGRVTLDYHGNPMNGTFEFTARKDKGKIVSPVGFDKEEEFERDEHVYLRKSFTKGAKTPKITLEVASGSAILKK